MSALLTCRDRLHELSHEFGRVVVLKALAWFLLHKIVDHVLLRSD